MKQLKIKITGSGDKWAISRMLEEVSHLIANTCHTKLENGVEWEDGILMTEISEDPDIKEDKTPKEILTDADIQGTAVNLDHTLSLEEINWVRLCYEDAQRQDPSGNWKLVVEDLIYQIPRIRDHE